MGLDKFDELYVLSDEGIGAGDERPSAHAWGGFTPLDEHDPLKIPFELMVRVFRCSKEYNTRTLLRRFSAVDFDPGVVVFVAVGEAAAHE